MTNAERMLLDDAMKTAIKGRVKLIRVGIGLAISTVLNLALIVVVMYLSWRIYG